MITTHNIKKVAGAALLSGAFSLVGLGLASGTAQAFNPQPEPPTHPNISVQQTTPQGSIRGFNPTTSPSKVTAGGVRGCDGSV